MKRLTQILISLFLAAAAFAVVPMASATPPVPALAGTWEITGTPNPGGCGPSTAFTNVATVTRDGHVINVDPSLGTFVGEAYQLGDKTFAVGFFGFISPIPGVRLNLEVQGTLEIAGPGQVTGNFRSTVSDPNGIFPECVYEGTIAGTRLIPMPY